MHYAEVTAADWLELAARALLSIPAAVRQCVTGPCRPA